MGDKKGKKKAANDEEDESTLQLGRIYRKKCEQNSIVPNKLFRQKYDLKVEEDENLEKLQLFDEMGPVGVRALMDAFAEIPYKHMKILKLWRVKAQDEGVRSICNFMIKSKVLEVLDLLDNEIGVLGCEFLGRALHPSEEIPLKKLKLDHNDFKTAGLAQLAKGLAMNDKLERLSLCYCGITADGSQFIQEILGNLSTALVKLKLQGNKLQNDGVREVFRALKINSLIEKIYIGDNQINLLDKETSKGVMDVIIETMKTRTNIFYYDFSYNGFTNEDGQKIIECIEQNKCICKVFLPELLSPAIQDKIKVLTKKRKPKKKKKGKKKK